MYPTIEHNKVLVNGALAKALCKKIDSAISFIDVMMFDWKWYKNDFSCDVSLINQALIRANKRGVKIRIISNSVEAKQFFAPVGVEVRHFKVHGVFHAKLWIFDNNSFLIGSHNMTMGAMTRNYEVSYMGDDSDSAIAFMQLFNSIWS